jgi:2-polyprenyl-3-methyl-5-hydroxy-6-metoxy-1,4-benzoquinol methylase
MRQAVNLSKTPDTHRQLAAAGLKYLDDIYEEAKAKADPDAKVFDVEAFCQQWIDAHPDESANPNSSGEHYDAIADHLAYDGFNVWINYFDPYIIPLVIYKPEPEVEDPNDLFNFGYLNADRNSKVFEIGCGTGLCGRLLTEQGFTHVDGADASEKCLALNRQSGWYRQLWHHYLGRGVENLPKEWINNYDVILAAGCFSKGHIQTNRGFDDVMAMLKVGGHFVTATRVRYFDDEDELKFKEKMDYLQETG